MGEEQNQVSGQFGRESLSARTKRLLMHYNLRASKRFGQNFLIDRNILHKIVEAAEIGPADRVMEIGPGLGALTAELLEQAGKVVAVELDRAMLEVLRQELGDAGNLVLVEGDILKLDWEELWQREFDGQPAGVLGNIPYNISTPIIIKLLAHHHLIPWAILMVQREVADRLKARPGSKDYGALTVAVAYRAEVRRIMTVTPGAFNPPPKVSSAVIRLDMLPQPSVAVRDEAFFFKVVRGAFQQRRKVLANSLADNLGMTKERISQAMEAAGIPPKARPEELSLLEFGRLSDALLC
ncbi:MAG: 16S rRNA (adenine(1518)-N(6)/adenine(1519)-N(6))-dimethyltransferase RsmA [bacterium]|nr:16S rRNA (adenine(1518)-N(6)/adenine(1519)-N(6))-dimethyltransferase RsmA [bacterium]